MNQDRSRSGYPNMPSKDANPTPAVDVVRATCRPATCNAKTGKIFTVKAKRVTAPKNGLLLP